MSPSAEKAKRKAFAGGLYRTSIVVMLHAGSVMLSAEWRQMPRLATLAAHAI